MDSLHLSSMHHICIQNSSSLVRSFGKNKWCPIRQENSSCAFMNNNSHQFLLLNYWKNEWKKRLWCGCHDYVMNMELDVNRIWKKQKEFYQQLDDGRNVSFFLCKRWQMNYCDYCQMATSKGYRHWQLLSPFFSPPLPCCCFRVHSEI